MEEVTPLVLVVDALEANLAHCQTLLRESCVDVVGYTDMKSALKLIRQRRPMLILCATQLADAEGYQLINRLRSKKQTCSIPVVLMTTRLSEQDMVLHQSLLQQVPVLPRPIQPARLGELIELFLGLDGLKSQLIAEGGEKRRHLLESRDEGVLVLDEQGTVVYANVAAGDLLSVSLPRLVGLSVEALLDDGSAQADPKWREHPIVKGTESQQKYQVDNALLWRADGQTINVKYAAVRLDNIASAQVLLVFKQLKASRESRSALAKMSQVDVLTGLPSRAVLEYRLDKVLNQAAQRNQHFALLYLDLDHTRYVNEALGHDLGDALIVAAADRIRQLVRREDFLARMEGDEFVILLTALPHPASAGEVARKAISRLHEPFLLDGHEIFTGCSIGIAVYPACGDTQAELIKHAEIALRRAKGLGRSNYQYYTQTMNQQLASRLRTEHELHKAWELKQFEVALLPHLDVETEALAAIEARLLWCHPTRGCLEADAFLSAAEEAGLGLEIMTWLWQEALQIISATVSEQDDAGCLRIVLPISVSLLAFDDLQGWMLEQIDLAGLLPEQMLVGVPESSLMRRHPEFQDVLLALHKEGVQFYLDNFGTGFGSLAQLRTLPYAFIRLSEEFVQRIGKQRMDAAIVDACIYLAHQLGINVMATHVDREDQGLFLAQRQCDWMQGSWVDAHIPPQQLAPWRNVLS